MAAAIDNHLIGQVLGETYEIERLIGEGGMGAVYQASHVRLPRAFAVKMLHIEALANPDVFQRFRREAEIASSIGHENITQVFDFNRTEEGVPFMVLELLDGEDLEACLDRDGAMSLAQTADLVEQVCNGLEAAHGAGVVHRDLKPANLFLCKRPKGRIRYKILDFGISKITTSSSLVTRTGSIMGTPNYMSPEQADGRVGDIDSRTDVFALACIVFQCLTGTLAFSGPTLMGTLYQIVHGEPADLATISPALPLELREVLERALRKDLNTRTPSVTQFCEEFLAVCTREGVPSAGPYPISVDGAGAVPTPHPKDPRLRAPKGSQPDFPLDIVPLPGMGERRKWYLGLGFGLVAAAGIAGMLLGADSQEPSAAPSAPPPVSSAQQDRPAAITTDARAAGARSAAGHPAAFLPDAGLAAAADDAGDGRLIDKAAVETPTTKARGTKTPTTSDRNHRRNTANAGSKKKLKPDQRDPLLDR